MKNGLNDAQALLDAMDGVAYVLDRDGVIILQSQSASDRSEGALRPCIGAVGCGRSIYDTIDSAVIRTVFREVHDAVWSGNRPRASFFCRCDVPEAERLVRMSLSLIQGENGPVGILLQSVQMREEPRVPLPLFTAQVRPHTRAPDRPIVVLCAFCLSVGWPANCGDAPDEWITAPEYYRRGGGSEVAISHGVCVPCYDRIVGPDGDASPFTQLS